MAADRSAVAEVLQSLIKRKLKLYLEEGQIHRCRASRSVMSRTAE